MKPVGIFYATREGHTQLIAERIAERLRDAGLPAETFNLKSAASPPAGLSQFEAAILAASIHVGKHEPEMVRFARENRDSLATLPNAFVSVSLSQVGASDAARTAAERAPYVADVQAMLDRFAKQTGWTPRITIPVAGALNYSQYNFLIRFIMKHMARKNGAPTDTSRDYDLTNWAALDAFAASFATQLHEQRQALSQ